MLTVRKVFNILSVPGKQRSCKTKSYSALASSRVCGQNQFVKKICPEVKVVRLNSDSVQHDVEDLLEYCVTIDPNASSECNNYNPHGAPVQLHKRKPFIGEKQAWLVTHGDRATNTQTWEAFIKYIMSQVTGWSD